MFCPICGAQLEDDALFCSKCGQKLSPEVAQSEPVAVTEESATQEVSAAPVEEATVVEEPAVVETPTTVEENQVVEDVKPVDVPKKKKSKILIIIPIVLLVLAIAAGAIYYFFFYNKGPAEIPAPFMYATEDELYVCDKIGEETEKIKISADYAGSYALSSDNKYIVYAENREEKEGDYNYYTEEYDTYYVYDIYAKELYNEEDEGTLLAKGVTNLQSFSSSDYIVYFEKNDDVYQSDMLANVDKIAKNCSIEEMSEDGKYLLVSTSNYDDDDDDPDYSEVIKFINLTKDFEETVISKSCDRYEIEEDFFKNLF